MANGDQFGNAVPLEQDAFGQPQELASAKKPSLLQRAEKWWTTPQQTEPDPWTLAKVGRAPATVESPREAASTSAKLGMAAASPSLPISLMEAPVATVLGLGGGVLGGTAGSMGGRYLGEKVGAPELGSDVGGLAGSLFGGYAGSRVPGLVKNTLIDAAGRPKPLARLTLGSDRARAFGELLDPEDAAYERRAQDLMRRGREQDVLDRQAARQVKLNAPDPLLQGRPSLFAGMTSSATPLGSAELPPIPQGEPTPFPRVMTRAELAEQARAAQPAPARTSPFAGAISSATPLGSAELPKVPSESRTSVLGAKAPQVGFVEKFKPTETPKSRIIQPGSETAKPPSIQGSYWSFDRESLANAAVMDRDAQIIYRQRFGDLPPGFKFLTDVGDAPTRGLYRGNQ